MFLGTFFFFFGVGVLIGLIYITVKFGPAIIYMAFDLVRTFLQEVKKGWEAGAPSKKD